MFPSLLLRALSRDVLFWATLPFLLTLGVSLCFVPHLAIAIYLFLSKILVEQLMLTVSFEWKTNYSLPTL